MTVASSGRMLAGEPSSIDMRRRIIEGTLDHIVWLILGAILDRWGWRYYFYYMVPFGLIGFALMVGGSKLIARGSQR